MRPRVGGHTIVLGAMAVALGAGVVACFDLFHSTSGIVSACNLDAQACVDAGAQADASGGDAGTDFCNNMNFGPVNALASAQHACAWLGACETPMGSNAFGTCMFDALLAYDCSANPNHPVRGVTHALWDCLRQVGSCDEVTRCVFPGGVPPCMWNGMNFTACGNGAGAQANADVRIECLDVEGGLAVGENCALEGRTCADNGGGASCAGAVAPECDASECVGSRLQQCTGGVNVGIDCASSGTGQCGGFPGGAAGVNWVACVASGASGASGDDAGCTPTEQATCSSGYASSCPSGVPETLFCPDLLQTSGSGCVAGPLSPSFDWTSPCAIDPPMCMGDSCEDGGVVGCARGAPYALDCGSQGLGPCVMVSTDVGTAMHAACTVISP